MWGSSLWEISEGDSPTVLVYVHCHQGWLGRHLGDTPLNVPVRVSTDVSSTILCTEALDNKKKKKKRGGQLSTRPLLSLSPRPLVLYSCWLPFQKSGLHN